MWLQWPLEILLRIPISHYLSSDYSSIIVTFSWDCNTDHPAFLQGSESEWCQWFCSESHKCRQRLQQHSEIHWWCQHHLADDPRLIPDCWRCTLYDPQSFRQTFCHLPRNQLCVVCSISGRWWDQYSAREPGNAERQCFQGVCFIAFRTNRYSMDLSRTFSLWLHPLDVPLTAAVSPCARCRTWGGW